MIATESPGKICSETPCSACTSISPMTYVLRDVFDVDDRRLLVRWSPCLLLPAGSASLAPPRCRRLLRRLAFRLTRRCASPSLISTSSDLVARSAWSKRPCRSVRSRRTAQLGASSTFSRLSSTIAGVGRHAGAQLRLGRLLNHHAHRIRHHAVDCDRSRRDALDLALDFDAGQRVQRDHDFLPSFDFGDVDFVDGDVDVILRIIDQRERRRLRLPKPRRYRRPPATQSPSTGRASGSACDKPALGLFDLQLGQLDLRLGVLLLRLRIFDLQPRLVDIGPGLSMSKLSIGLRVRSRLARAFSTCWRAAASCAVSAPLATLSYCALAELKLLVACSSCSRCWMRADRRPG